MEWLSLKELWPSCIHVDRNLSSCGGIISPVTFIRSDDVLVCQLGSIMVARLQIVIVHDEEESISFVWDTESDAFDISENDYWMPIPEPPKTTDGPE